VNNSAYTNAVVKLALEFAVTAAGILDIPSPPEWGEVAAGLAIPFNITVPGHPEFQGGYHPEYDGFNGPFPKATVKQADTIMLNFPLGVGMDSDVLSNDLEYYTEVTDNDGPAMTWAIFAIDWMDVALANTGKWSGNFTNAIKYFNKGYANVHRPYNVSDTSCPPTSCSDVYGNTGVFFAI
jgi:trehalose/maltose hydrolase-like predicted phosphorylase